MPNELLHLIVIQEAKNVGSSPLQLIQRTGKGFASGLDKSELYEKLAKKGCIFISRSTMARLPMRGEETFSQREHLTFPRTIAVGRVPLSNVILVIRRRQDSHVEGR